MKKKASFNGTESKNKKQKLSEEFSDNDSSEISSKEYDSADEYDSLKDTKKGDRKSDDIKHAKNKSLYASGKEINNFKETENLFHSNLFRMQIEELLHEMKISPNKRSVFNEWIEKLKNAIFEMKDSQVKNMNCEVWENDLKVKVPISNIRCDKGTLKFITPSDVQVIGSYAHELTVSKHFEVDVLLKIPKSFFKNSDYLNHRYLQKRAFYLAYVASQLRKHDFIGCLKYCTLVGNLMLPALKIIPSGHLGKKITFRVMLSPEETAFQLSRFIPKRNNVRSKWFDTSTVGEPEDPATPHHNSYILHDIVACNLHNYISENLSSNNKIKEGIILLKIWLHQRSLDKGQGAFSGFIMTMFILYLLKKRRISPLMSCYQVARTTWLALAGDEWPVTGITFSDCADGPTLQEFSNHFEVIFVEPSGYLNLCADMSKERLLRVKHEAKLALEYLNDYQLNSFDYLFMTPVLFNRKFDALLKVSDTSQLKNTVSHCNLRNPLLDYCGNYVMATRRRIIDIIHQAVGSRISLIATVSNGEIEEWNVDADAPETNNSAQGLTFGFLFDPDHFTDVLIKGPNGDDPKAASFREFWGDKCNLRRFQDGSICEAVVWPGSSLSERRNVMEHILKYILSRHATLNPSDMVYVCNQLDSVLALPNITLPENLKSYGTGEEANLILLQSFDSLSASLRKLSGLPLTITSIQGISPVFRLTEVFPALPTKCNDGNSYQSLNGSILFDENHQKVPKYVPPLEVVIQLESSGKWPDDIEALQRVKAAFYLRLAKLLGEQCFLKANVTASYLDVYKDGYVFRIVVSCQKEIVLLKTVKTPDDMVKLRDNPKSLELEHTTVTLPKLSSTLHGLQKYHSAFSSAVRMAKRWISSQLLQDHIPEVTIELIMAHIFIQPAPYVVPSTPLVAFQRFLHLLSSHDWKSLPLIVNLNNALTGDDIAEIQGNFSKNRSTLPSMFVSSTFDKNSQLTKHLPTVQVLHRLMLLSKESLTILDNSISAFDTDSSFMRIFKTSLKCFDAVIHLKTNMIPKFYQQIHSKGSKLNFSSKLNVQDDIPITDFDPVKLYLAELKNSFDDIALFFCDNFGGDVIAVLFKPSAKVKVDFKLSSAECRKLEGKQMSVNIPAVLEDFLHLGRGFVKNVQCN